MCSGAAEGAADKKAYSQQNVFKHQPFQNMSGVTHRYTFLCSCSIQGRPILPYRHIALKRHRFTTPRINGIYPSTAPGIISALDEFCEGSLLGDVFLWQGGGKHYG